jgi:integrase/recombinase XerD
VVSGGEKKAQAVGDFSEVIEAARRKSIEVNAQKAGIIESIQGPEQHRVTIGQAIDKYLDFIKAHRKQRTYVTYRYTLDKLLKQSCQRSFVDQVTREDILQFMTDCYKRGLGKRTVYDKLVVVLQLFKRHGKTKLIEPSDWPDYDEIIRPIYEAEEIAAMLKHADQNESIFLKFLLGSGFRDREVRYVAWRDIDFRNSLARVTIKPSRRVGLMIGIMMRVLLMLTGRDLYHGVNAGFFALCLYGAVTRAIASDVPAKRMASTAKMRTCT